MITERDTAPVARRGTEQPPRPGLLHVHRYRWSADQPFGNGSLYACRCGAVRCGF
jgi:hypothetical protein